MVFWKRFVVHWDNSAVNEDELLIRTTPWVNLRDVTPSERSRIQ